VLAGLTFGEGTVAGVFMEARHIIWSAGYNGDPRYNEKMIC
jgi:hypothetical protein